MQRVFTVAARQRPIALVGSSFAKKRTVQSVAAFARFASTMKALVYSSKDRVTLQERPVPKLASETDAIIKVTRAAICGTDLHIIKGDVPECKPGIILGHEGEGIVHEVGSGVTNFKKGDRVLISCISSCYKCDYCRRGMNSHCTSGGWVLGRYIDGIQAEYTRVPHADTSLYTIPEGVTPGAMVMLSDIFPTSLECGVQNGRVGPGSTVAIVGAGPVGLAAIMTAQMYSPSKIIVLDMDPKRLDMAKKLGATHCINNGEQDGLSAIMDITGGNGADTVIEAVGIPATFDMCQKALAAGGVLANVGVHGVPVNFELDELWAKNIAVTTRLVDGRVTPMLINQVKAGKLDAMANLITHRYKLEDGEEAYDTFRAADKTGAIKVLLETAAAKEA